MILVDVANGKQRHVPYRDSKLTFLLQVTIFTSSLQSPCQVDPGVNINLVVFLPKVWNIIKALRT